MAVRKNFLDGFKATADKHHDRIALFNVLNSERTLGISYFELNRLSDELANYFLNIFSDEPQYIAVSVTEYFQLSFLLLGIWKSGCTFAGIGSQYTPRNNLNFLDFLYVKFLITDHEDNNYGGDIISCFCINEQKFFVWKRKTEERIYHSENICFGIMTSGSTGDPKVIQVPWECILPNAVELSHEFQIDYSDCIFQASPYTFDPFFIEFFLSVLNGCGLMIVSSYIKLSSSTLLKMLFQKDENVILHSESQSRIKSNFQCKFEHVHRRRVTFLQMTPSIFKRWKDNDIKEILSLNTSLKVLVLGGEKFPTEILYLRHKENKTRIFNIYGITEISCWAFLNEVRSHENEVSIGKPLKNITYKISNNELFLGSRSRICVVDNERNFSEKNPVFRNSGDIIRIVNDELYYVSRSNQIVKKYGIKVNLNKIEELFLKINNFIKECFCVFDDRNLKLGLFYLPVKKDKNNYAVDTLEGFLKIGFHSPENELKDVEKPDYFIQIHEIPLNPNGKCNRQNLTQYLRKISKPHALKTDLETTFCKIWQEVLRLNSAESSKSFKDLGGNSILALQIINKLEFEGIEVPQNFVVKLLGDGNYRSSLECLNLAENSRSQHKRLKLDDNVHNKFKLSVNWKFNLEKCVDATPSVFSYKGNDRIVVGSHSSKLTCLNAKSGEEFWTVPLGDRIESGFKVTKDGSRGFVGCYDHFVYCIAVSDGSTIWTYKTNDMVKSTPCLSSDEEILYVASYDKQIHCVMSNNGQLLVKLKISDSGIFSSGIVSNTHHTFHIGTLDGTCIALSQNPTKIKWKNKLKSPVFASPCLNSVETEIVFAEVLGIVHCMNVDNGDKIWTYEAQGNIYSSPLMLQVDNLNYIVFGCHDRSLYCLLSKATPELKWKSTLDSAVFATPCAVVLKPTLTNSQTICAATTEGFIYLCDFISGFVRSHIQLQGEVFSSPVFKNSQLFFGCRDDFVYSVQIQNIESF